MGALDAYLAARAERGRGGRLRQLTGPLQIELEELLDIPGCKR